MGVFSDIMSGPPVDCGNYKDSNSPISGSLSLDTHSHSFCISTHLNVDLVILVFHSSLLQNNDDLTYTCTHKHVPKLSEFNTYIIRNLPRHGNNNWLNDVCYQLLSRIKCLSPLMQVSGTTCLNFRSWPKSVNVRVRRFMLLLFIDVTKEHHVSIIALLLCSNYSNNSLHTQKHRDLGSRLAEGQLLHCPAWWVEKLILPGSKNVSWVYVRPECF